MRERSVAYMNRASEKFKKIIIVEYYKSGKKNGVFKIFIFC